MAKPRSVPLYTFIEIKQNTKILTIHENNYILSTLFDRLHQVLHILLKLQLKNVDNIRRS